MNPLQNNLLAEKLNEKMIPKLKINEANELICFAYEITSFSLMMKSSNEPINLVNEMLIERCSH